ncbi:polysaccharide pyruvyl transferase CsaB [Candidatus Cyanaurora vandensis]|uniref:polysaccharide pyruvyl transferase CsaB n=1 Tax=Candidatus Cyanaurora vandensis TaxID=2714958 RepID=UPI00257AB09E|nr:polysaccharide pyruvyl transferase CsaB [Candidatus Cyanaurora vandensis]
MQAVLCGYYGFGNGGDEALLASLLQMLPPDLTPIVLSHTPKLTETTYQVRAVDRWDTPAVIQAMRSSDYFILGGGSILQDVTSPRSLLYYSGLLWLAQRLGLKTVAWSQGLGPLNKSWSRRLVRHLLQGCDHLSVRDRNSAQLLASWSLLYTQTVDPVWALTGKVAHLPDLPRPRGAVVLRPHPDLTPERLSVLMEALGQFQRATEICLLLVPFQLPGDLALAQQVQQQLPGPSVVLELSDPRQLRGLFDTVEWTLAMRFHGVLMAAGAGCPVWGLSYDPKVKQLLQELDAPGLDLMDLPNAGRLTQLWLEHYANGEGLSETQRAWWLDRAQINQHILKDLRP